MESKNSNEIDLAQLFFTFVRAIIANILLVSVLLVAGVVAGLVLSYTSKKVYKSEMIVSSGWFTPFFISATTTTQENVLNNYGVLDASIAEEMIRNLDKLIRSKNFELIQAKINVDDETAQSIVHLDMEVLEGSSSAKQEEGQRINFLITATVSNASVLPEVEKGLIYYLEHNEYLKIRVDQRKRYYQELIGRAEREIRDLEAFKERVYKGDLLENLKGNLTFDPTVINSKILDISKEKLEYENALALASSIDVIEGFNTWHVPKLRSKLFYIAAGFLVGGLLALAIIFIKQVAREVRAEREESAKAA